MQPLEYEEDDADVAPAAKPKKGAPRLGGQRTRFRLRRRAPTCPSPRTAGRRPRPAALPPARSRLRAALLVAAAAGGGGGGGRKRKDGGEAGLPTTTPPAAKRVRGHFEVSAPAGAAEGEPLGRRSAALAANAALGRLAASETHAHPPHAHAHVHAAHGAVVPLGGGDAHGLPPRQRSFTAGPAGGHGHGNGGAAGAHAVGVKTEGGAPLRATLGVYGVAAAVNTAVAAAAGGKPPVPPLPHAAHGGVARRDSPSTSVDVKALSSGAGGVAGCGGGAGGASSGGVAAMVKALKDRV